MVTKKKASWTENEFENWFVSHPRLPRMDKSKVSEKVLVVSRHKAIMNMVDLIAVDKRRGLVIIEVKNETGNRKAIGQALEYLSLNEDIRVEDLEAEFYEYKKKSLRDEFKKLFGPNLKSISARRHVYLVAPRHDPYSGVCAKYLSTSFLKQKGFQPKFHLLTATKVGNGFRIRPYDPPRLVKGYNVKPGFHLGPWGKRLFYVFSSGALPIVWSIGKWRTDDDTLTLPHTPSRRKLLRRIGQYLLPLDNPAPQVDLKDSGSVWRHRKQPWEATVLGYLRSGNGKENTQELVAFAQFKDGSFDIFRQLKKDWFEKKWERTKKKPKSWIEIAKLAQERLNAVLKKNLKTAKSK